MISLDHIPPDLPSLVNRALCYEDSDTRTLAIRQLELAGWLLALETDGHGNTRDAVVPLTEQEIDFAWREFGDTVTAHRRLEVRALLRRHAGLRAACEGVSVEALIMRRTLPISWSGAPSTVPAPSIRRPQRMSVTRIVKYSVNVAPIADRRLVRPPPAGDQVALPGRHDERDPKLLL